MVGLASPRAGRGGRCRCRGRGLGGFRSTASPARRRRDPLPPLRRRGLDRDGSPAASSTSSMADRWATCRRPTRPARVGHRSLAQLRLRRGVESSRRWGSDRGGLAGVAHARGEPPAGRAGPGRSLHGARNRAGAAHAGHRSPRAGVAGDGGGARGRFRAPAGPAGPALLAAALAIGTKPTGAPLALAVLVSGSPCIGAGCGSTGGRSSCGSRGLRGRRRVVRAQHDQPRGSVVADDRVPGSDPRPPLFEAQAHSLLERPKESLSGHLDEYEHLLAGYLVLMRPR